MLNLRKPLAFFDLETTGTNVTQDRIVELSIVKIHVGGQKSIKTTRVNPGIPIPIESSLIHGIYDEDIQDKPTFKEIAKSLSNFIDGCDLGGFNILRFDVPLLAEEFLRAGVEFDINNRKIVDVQRIFHLMEPRNLSAAYKFYCQKELEGAHSAEADTLATFEVLLAMVDRYKGCTIKDKDGNETEPVKNDVAALHELSSSNFADLVGRIVYNDKGEEVFNFGKYRNQKVEDVFRKDPSYYDWIMKGDFALNTKNKITEIKLRKLTQKF